MTGNGYKWNPIPAAIYLYRRILFNRSEQTLILKSTNIAWYIINRALGMCLQSTYYYNIVSRLISKLSYELSKNKCTRNVHNRALFRCVCTYNNRRIYIKFELCVIKEARTYIYTYTVKQRLVLLRILNFWLVLFAKGALGVHYVHTLTHNGAKVTDCSVKITAVLSTCNE